MKAKEPVTLRKRLMSSGRTSLYLDIKVNGARKYEYLQLYLEPGSSVEVKTHNRQTLTYAEEIRAQRLLELRNQRFGLAPIQTPDVLFFPIYDSLAKEKGTGTHAVRSAARMHLLKYSHERLTFRDITPQWVERFVQYLRNEGLRKSTISTYLQVLNAVLNSAMKESIIAKNPMANIAKSHKTESERSFLTFAELTLLATTPIKPQHEHIRKAFLFSCLTGLRVSDIKALTWAQVSKVGEMTRITFKQKKTKGLQYLDINDQAAKLMGDAGKPLDYIFNLPAQISTNTRLRKWVAEAGIQKHITFHSGRHTFAVLMLDLGTDIYTVQKLLGHANIATTQIYAKVLDKNKQEAVQKIPDIFSK